MKQQGFTLIEMLLGLIVTSFLAQLAVPGFKGLLESQQRQTEAIARNRAVVIHAKDEDWSLGWRVILDVSGRGHLDDDNPVLLERESNGRVPVAGNGPVTSQVRFSGLGEPVFAGGGFRAGTVHVCGKDQAQSLYQIVLAPSGRVSLRNDKTEQALCRGYSSTLAVRATSGPAVPWASRT